MNGVSEEDSAISRYPYRLDVGKCGFWGKGVKIERLAVESVPFGFILGTRTVYEGDPESGWN